MAVKVKSKNPPKEKPRTFFDDIGAWFDQSGQAYSHGAKQIADWSDDTTRYFGGQPTGFGPTALLRSIGQGYRGDPAQDEGAIFDESDRRASAALRGRRDVRGNNAPVEQAPQAMSFSDYLAMAQQLLGGGSGGTDYSALVDQLKRNASEGDARLKAMYDAYQQRVIGSAPGISQVYDQTGAGIDQNGLQATDQINDAYQSSRDAQTQQLAALGIGDTAGVLAGQGGQAANDQAFNLSGVSRAQQASGDLNTSNKGTALDYNTNFGNAVGMSGVEQRSSLQQALQTKLAELESQQASEQSDDRSQQLSLAFQLAQNQQLVDPNAPPDVMAELDAQAAAAKLYAQQLKNQQLAQSMGGSVGGNLAAYQQLAQQYGIDPSNLEEFTKFVQTVRATQ